METQSERFPGTEGIVLYKSKYGATKRYAEMLASAVPFDIADISKVNVRDLKDYDVIVYGGGIYASGIAGLGFLKKNMKNPSEYEIWEPALMEAYHTKGLSLRIYRLYFTSSFTRWNSSRASA